MSAGWGAALESLGGSLMRYGERQDEMAERQRMAEEADRRALELLKKRYAVEASMQRPDRTQEIVPDSAVPTGYRAQTRVGRVNPDTLKYEETVEDERPYSPKVVARPSRKEKDDIVSYDVDEFGRETERARAPRYKPGLLSDDKPKPAKKVPIENSVDGTQRYIDEGSEIPAGWFLASASSRYRETTRPGSSEKNPASYKAFEGEPPSGTWVKMPSGKVIQIP